ncbi:hypothetical protein FRX31_022217 [Thalictrum thalictroides]|uniref:Uncharacterized protein n=1 Tax=Thalictrum thalictroides TaxID=46969 RepID=A0A7J6VU02_THATH|nr:hypothetical protein FRX31_022217 [Thalictrum thalictroides]
MDFRISNSPNMRFKARSKAVSEERRNFATTMEGASTLMHKVDDNQKVQDEEMLDELSFAFNKSRSQNRGKVDIDLQGVKEENEERWCKTLLIGHDYGVCKEFRECQRNFGRELTRDEAKMVMNFSYSQKDKSFKFGAGIQTRHIIEVDPIAESSPTHLAQVHVDPNPIDVLALIAEYPSPNLDLLLKDDPTPKDNVSAIFNANPLFLLTISKILLHQTSPNNPPITIMLLTFCL